MQVAWQQSLLNPPPAEYHAQPLPPEGVGPVWYCPPPHSTRFSRVPSLSAIVGLAAAAETSRESMSVLSKNMVK